MILRVGLTGGIASGKSTIRRVFDSLGCFTVDADVLVARLYEPGQPGHAALVATYGEDILAEDGRIDRTRLANIAFSHPDEARKLNSLIHPIVLQYTSDMADEYERTHDDAIAIVEATLLLEAGGRERYDRIVVVDIPLELQIERGVKRGLAREEVTRRIANQMSREERLRQADYVIDNSGDEASGRRETERVHALLLRDLEAKKKRPGRSPGA